MGLKNRPAINWTSNFVLLTYLRKSYGRQVSNFQNATYHRGQIATDFKNTGLQPLVTDYIFYKRG